MKVVGYTDVIQVAVLLLGGLATSYLALTLVSEKFGLGHSAIAGFQTLLHAADDHFHMIFAKPTPSSSPGIREQVPGPAGAGDVRRPASGWPTSTTGAATSTSPSARWAPTCPRPAPASCSRPCSS